MNKSLKNAIVELTRAAYERGWWDGEVLAAVNGYAFPLRDPDRLSRAEKNLHKEISAHVGHEVLIATEDQCLRCWLREDYDD